MKSNLNGVFWLQTLNHEVKALNSPITFTVIDTTFETINEQSSSILGPNPNEIKMNSFNFLGAEVMVRFLKFTAIFILIISIINFILVKIMYSFKNLLSSSSGNRNISLSWKDINDNSV